MADKRIIELTEAASVDRNSYVAVDDSANGTKKLRVGDMLDAAAEAGTNMATNTSFALIGTSEGSALANTIYGMSVQDGTPTPTSPVDIESAVANFKCVGKNLIPYPYSDGTSKTSNGITYTVNDDGSITVNGTATAVSRFGVRAESLNNVKSGERVTLSGCPSGGSNSKYALYTQTVNNFDLGNGVTFDWAPNISGIAIVIYSGQTVNNLVFKPMLTLAGTDQTFELYKYKDVTTDLTLRAIEVASTDDYTYERNGKYYIADTVDWSEDNGYVITRRIKELNAKEKTWYLYNNLVYANIVDAYKVNVIISNRFPYSNPVSNNTFDMVFTSTPGIWHLNVQSDDTDSVENWTNYINTNDVIFVYALKTPTIEHITSEQAQALLSLKTYDEATSIDCVEDIAPVVDLEYASNGVSALALIGHNEAYLAQELENLYGVKNLIPYPYYETSKTANGLTFTDNGDGSLDVNGTATAITFFNFVYRTENVDLGLSEGDFIRCSIEGCPSTGALMSVRFRDNTDADISDISVRNNPINVRVPSGYDHIYVYFYISSGTTLSNITLKPMLRLATIQSDEYEPYAMSNRELTHKIANSGLITEEDFSASSVNGLFNKSVTNIIAGIENGSTASKAYNANDLILRSHNLYEVTVDVASGTTWEVGTNLEVTTIAAQFDKINADLSDVKSNTKTLIETITAFSASTTYNIDISGYNEVEFEILGNYSSSSNKYHVVKRFKVEDIMDVVSDTTNKNTDMNAPTIAIVCAVSNTDHASLYIGFVDATTWKFNKFAATYNINSVKVYGCK